jgi:hypothetical protein
MKRFNAALGRALQNRWIAFVSAILIGYVSLRVFADVAKNSYYNFYAYPRLKGAEYVYPEIRYTLGQAAILVWSVIGVWSTALLATWSLFRNQHRCIALSVTVFLTGIPILFVGFLVGMSLRGVI